MAWIEKQRSILDFALSSLGRTWRKNLAVFAVYAVIVFLLASVVFFTSSLKREASLLLQESPEIVVQKLVAGRHDLIPETYLKVIGDIPGVSGVRGRLWGYYFDPTVGANLTVMVDESEVHWPDSMMIGHGVARTFQLQKGDQMLFTAADGSEMRLRVAEISSAASELVAADFIGLSTRDFRKLLGVQEGYYTDLVLQVRNKREMATVADKIKQRLPDTRPILRDEMRRTYEAVFDWRSGLLVFMLGGAVLAFIIFALDKATSLSFEERREIGILKAVGWETSEVIAMKSWEGIVISLSAFLAGTIGAYVHVFHGGYVFFEPADRKSVV